MPSAQVAVRLDGAVISAPTIENVPAIEGTDERQGRDASQFAQVQIACDLSVYDGQVTEVVRAIAEVRCATLAAFDKMTPGEIVSLVVTPYATWTPKRGNGRSFNIVRYRFIGLVAEKANALPKLAAAV